MNKIEENLRSGTTLEAETARLIVGALSRPAVVRTTYLPPISMVDIGPASWGLKHLRGKG